MNPYIDIGEELSWCGFPLMFFFYRLTSHTHTHTHTVIKNAEDGNFHHLTFTVGHGDSVIEGFDVAILSFQVGEQAEVQIAPDYAFEGDGGYIDGLTQATSPRIPPFANVLFDITLLELERGAAGGDGLKEGSRTTNVNAHSNIDTHSVKQLNQDYVSEAGSDAESDLRNARPWGRMYIERAGLSIQYFRAHFGGNIPNDSLPLMVSDLVDPTGCEPPSEEGTYAGTIVVVTRGVCTFTQKARIAQGAGASGIIVVNNEDGLDNMPGPDGNDITIAVMQIPESEGGM
jgi:hypothetical protein